MICTFHGETLADYTADPPIRGVVDGFNGQAMAQIEPLYNQADQGLYTRGNTIGEISFVADCSYASLDDCADALATAYNLLGIQDDLVIEYGAGILTMAAAVLVGVTRIAWIGTQLKVRYTFKITTVVSS